MLPWKRGQAERHASEKAAARTVLHLLGRSRAAESGTPRGQGKESSFVPLIGHWAITLVWGQKAESVEQVVEVLGSE
jgi:hypothetical protein